MSYINVGAQLRGDIATKKALKDAVKEANPELRFYGTSEFTPFEGKLDAIPNGTTLVVTGPNPYTNRKWYANVKRVNGKVVVS